jgi:hypothetical protein
LIYICVGTSAVAMVSVFFVAGWAGTIGEPLPRSASNFTAARPGWQSGLRGGGWRPSGSYSFPLPLGEGPGVRGIASLEVPIASF